MTSVSLHAMASCAMVSRSQRFTLCRQRPLIAKRWHVPFDLCSQESICTTCWNLNVNNCILFFCRHYFPRNPWCHYVRTIWFVTAGNRSSRQWSRPILVHRTRRNFGTVDEPECFVSHFPLIITLLCRLYSRFRCRSSWKVNYAAILLSMMILLHLAKTSFRSFSLATREERAQICLAEHCDVSSRQCPPCAEYLWCTGFSSCHCVANYQLSAIGIVPTNVSRHFFVCFVGEVRQECSAGDIKTAGSGFLTVPDYDTRGGYVMEWCVPRLWRMWKEIQRWHRVSVKITCEANEKIMFEKALDGLWPWWKEN